MDRTQRRPGLPPRSRPHQRADGPVLPGAAELVRAVRLFKQKFSSTRPLRGGTADAPARGAGKVIDSSDWSFLLLLTDGVSGAGTETWFR